MSASRTPRTGSVVVTTHTSTTITKTLISTRPFSDASRRSTTRSRPYRQSAHLANPPEGNRQPSRSPGGYKGNDRITAWAYAPVRLKLENHVTNEDAP